MFENDQEKFAFMRENLFTAVICDILDDLGYRRQAMHRRLRPLLPDRDNCGFAGRARTLRWMEIDHIVEEDPYGLEIEAIDSVKPGDVLIHSTELGCNCAPWGELMTTIAKRNGAVGCVCDSGVRDCTRIIKMAFPVFYADIVPFDSKGRARVMDLDQPIRCGDVLVNAGELVFADFDGVVVIPKDVEEETLEKSREKVEGENVARKELLAGRTLRDVYNEYRIM